DVTREISPRKVERLGRATREIFRPLQVTRARISGLQRTEQCVVVQPVRVIPTEALEREAQIDAPAGAEILPCPLKQCVLESSDGIEIDGSSRKGVGRAVLRKQQPVLDQPVGADQQLIAGKRRQRLVW